MQETTLDAIWTNFCDQLAEARRVLLQPDAPRDTLSQAEGVRYLSRLTRAALDSLVESADPDFPRLFQMSNDTIKIGGDNPDNVYWNATIAGDRDYRICGNRGSVPYLSFGTKANRFSLDGGMVSTGELEDTKMHFDADGSFEIIVSRTAQGKNWLSMSDDTSFLLIRQTFLDKAVEQPASITIERLNGPAIPPVLSPEWLERQFEQAANFVSVTANTFSDWTKLFMTRPNELLPWNQNIFQKVGGDPNIHYLHGYWRLSPGEMWVIETDVPQCRFWNFVLQNWWMESADYRNILSSWTNINKAKLNAEGHLVIVVADKDPGFGNWIDTCGRTNGTALLRWISADRHPIPKCTLSRLQAQSAS